MTSPRMGIPLGCAARMQWILDRADELALTFANGNKSDLSDALRDMPPDVAFAVLATVCASHVEAADVARYLQNAA